ncbi:hypothetical protein [Vannielia litorea]|uniref:hypothetical protein n=1 Tax=Vannielia litorea TaxID=1217970 RepID=UPI001BCFEDDE|nr:hypothetical protein [Vannielia litorea]MBS8227787.1 hypothetical protein [Vannielia litorea]
MATVRIILIVAVLAVMGGIGYMQYAAVGTAAGALGPASDDYAALDEAEEPARSTASSSGSYSGGNLIKSTKTSSRVGGDKTITIQRKKPGLWMRIRMWFGYEPEDAHRRDMARLKAQREAEARRSKGVNTVTGRKESTAKAASSGPSRQRKAAPNKSVASALGGG